MRNESSWIPLIRGQRKEEDVAISIEQETELEVKGGEGSRDEHGNVDEAQIVKGTTQQKKFWSSSS